MIKTISQSCDENFDVFHLSMERQINNINSKRTQRVHTSTQA